MFYETAWNNSLIHNCEKISFSPLFSRCISPQGGLHTYLSIPCFFGGSFQLIYSICFHPPASIKSKGTASLLPGDPLYYHSHSSLLRSLGSVCDWSAVHIACCVVTHSLSFSSPKLAKQLLTQLNRN